MTTFSIIPVQPVPSQLLTVALGGNRCQLSIYVKKRYPLGEAPSPALFIDVYNNDVLIRGGVICKNACSIIRDAYINFVGELIFVDMEGDDDPEYPGLGSRWILGYLL